MFGNAFLLLFVSSLLVCASPLSVSFGVSAKVGSASVRVTSKASQRYKAGYFFADDMTLGLFADSVLDASHVSILGMRSATPALEAKMPGVLRDPGWREQRLNMLSRLEFPTTGIFGDPTADPVFVTQDVGRNAAYGIVLPGGAASAGRYAIVPIRDVEVLSGECVQNHDYVRGGLEAFVRVSLRAHRRMSVGLEAGWSFNLGAKTRIENVGYAVFPVRERKSYTSLADGSIAAPVDVKSFAYEIAGHEMVKDSWIDVDVQDQQKVALLLQGHVTSSVSVAFSCGVRHSKVECVLGGGHIAYPYAHRSISEIDGGNDPYRVAFEGIKCEGGVWAPVFGLSAECMTVLGTLVLGVEYSCFDVQLKDVVQTFRNPQKENVNAYEVAFGWHMSRVAQIDQMWSCKLNMQSVSATVSFIHRL